MNTDFLDAHKRHWEDAELFRANLRIANADHLYGMSAECGLKKLMIAFGMQVDSSGTPTKPDKKHADEIWIRYETYRSGHHQGVGYGLGFPNPFANWNVRQRYSKRSEFDEARLSEHRKGAQAVRSLIAKARKEGLI